MDTDTQKLLQALQSQTEAMQQLTEAVGQLVDSNAELIDIVTSDEEFDQPQDGELGTYLDGTPIGG